MIDRSTEAVRDGNGDRKYSVRGRAWAWTWRNSLKWRRSVAVNKGERTFYMLYLLICDINLTRDIFVSQYASMKFITIKFPDILQQKGYLRLVLCSSRTGIVRSLPSHQSQLFIASVLKLRCPSKVSSTRHSAALFLTSHPPLWPARWIILFLWAPAT